MKPIKDLANDFAIKRNTSAYVMKNYPNATGDNEKFIDESIIIDNADGLEFNFNNLTTKGSLIIATVKPFKCLKRRPNEKNPIKIYGTKEYSLAAKHIKLLLNNIDCKKAIPLLKNVFSCQKTIVA